MGDRTSPEERLEGGGGALQPGFGSLAGGDGLGTRTRSGPVLTFLGSHPVSAGGGKVPKKDEARDRTKKACPWRDRRARARIPGLEPQQMGRPHTGRQGSEAAESVLRKPWAQPHLEPTSCGAPQSAPDGRKLGNLASQGPGQLQGFALVF